MPISPVSNSITRFPNEFSVTDMSASGNPQASQPPVPGNSEACLSPSRPSVGAALQEQLLLENAKSLAEKDPHDFCRRFDAKASKLTEKSRIALAWFVVEKSPVILANHIQKFEIDDKENKIKLARIVAEKVPSVLVNKIQGFKIDDKGEMLELAKKIAEEAPIAFANKIQNFKIEDEKNRIELARIIAEKVPVRFAMNIGKFDIFNQEIKIELAHRVVEKVPSVLPSKIQDFKIDDERERFELAKIVAEKEPRALAENIQNFAIDDESTKIRLAKIIGERYLPSNGINENVYLERLKISDPSARTNLYALLYLRLIAAGAMSAADETWVKRFFPGGHEPMTLAQVAAQVGRPISVIADLLANSSKWPADSPIRETLFTWTHLVSLCFAADQLSAAAQQELEAPLKAIQKWRAPAMRYVLTDLLAQYCLPPDAGDVNGFFAFCKKFAKPHTRLYPILLFPIFQSAPDASTLENLKMLLSQHEFRNVNRRKSMVNALLALTQADRLSDDLKRSLLQAALPNGIGKEAARSLECAASCMECLLLLVQHPTEIGDAVLQRLQSIRNPDDFNAQVNEVFKNLFPDLSNARNAAAQFRSYMEYARNPVGVLRYAAKMQSNQNGDEKASVMAAIEKFVKATVLSSHPVDDFRQLRYDPAKSPHLRKLADKAPAAFAQWQQPCIYEPFAAFLAQTSNGTKQTDIAAYLQQRVVMDRHVSQGAYPLLEQVLAGQMPLASALQESKRHEASASGVEADLLRLLDERTPMEQKTGLITRLQESLPQDQFYQDLTDLKGLLMPSSRQDAKHFRVIDTDAAEDLFLCGTEVTGSCQNIQGSIDLNKALMGYVLDGKYRMLAITAEDGRLMGRRMLRLLWDEQTQQPVLHLERLYHNPGVPEKYEQALVELALQKAKQMKCVLVSHDQALQSGDCYPAPLIAHPTPWPFEFVDAKGLAVQAGEKGYELSEAEIVTSLH